MTSCVACWYPGTLDSGRRRPAYGGDAHSDRRDPGAMAYHPRPRYCARCTTRLALDNADRFCAACRAKARDDLVKPPTLPREFWLHDHLRRAVESWHFGRLIAAYRSHPYHGRILS